MDQKDIAILRHGMASLINATAMMVKAAIEMEKSLACFYEPAKAALPEDTAESCLSETDKDRIKASTAKKLSKAIANTKSQKK